MKKIYIAALVFLLNCVPSYSNTFSPYIGLDLGANVANYTFETELDDVYYYGTINAGARIGGNFGVEFFAALSDKNEIEYTNDLYSEKFSFDYMAFGFDIFAYYNLTPDFDFFTSFGVANYKINASHEYTDLYQTTSDSDSDNNVSTRLGIGLMFNFPGDDISGLIKYNYIPLNNSLINTISEFSIGIRYLF